MLLCSWSTAFSPWSSLPRTARSAVSLAPAYSVVINLPLGRLPPLLALDCPHSVFWSCSVRWMSTGQVFAVLSCIIAYRSGAWGPYGEWGFQVTLFSGPSILQAPGEGFPRVVPTSRVAMDTSPPANGCCSPLIS